MINLDHAATQGIREEALDAMLECLRDGETANPSAAHGLGRKARARLETARENIARLLGANAHEVVFTSGGTESDCWALFGTAAAQKARRHLAVSAIEHHAVLDTAGRLAECGFDVTKIRPDGEGIVHPETVAEAIRPDTFLVSVMLANNEVGTIQPIREIAGEAHARGTYLHTDAVQAIGHIPVDFAALGADFLAASAHKFGGPPGVGFLLIREGSRIRPLLEGGGQEHGLRSGTENVSGAAGAAAALQAAVREMRDETERLARLRQILLDGILKETEGVSVNGSMDERLPGNLHLSVEGADQNALLMRLDMMGIAASAGSACAAGSTERSHVLRAMGLDHGQAYLRLTLGPENTEGEMREAAVAIGRAVAEIRGLE